LAGKRGYPLPQSGRLFLSEVVEGVFRQTYTAFEVIVLGKGSEDDTVEVAFGYAAEDSRVKLIWQ
jgi:glycosyltransferase involved in cell wall biosynthesis